MNHCCLLGHILSFVVLPSTQRLYGLTLFFLEPCFIRLPYLSGPASLILNKSPGASNNNTEPHNRCDSALFQIQVVEIDLLKWFENVQSFPCQRLNGFLVHVALVEIVSTLENAGVAGQVSGHKMILWVLFCDQSPAIVVKKTFG